MEKQKIIFKIQEILHEQIRRINWRKKISKEKKKDLTLSISKNSLKARTRKYFTTNTFENKIFTLCLCADLSMRIKAQLSFSGTHCTIQYMSSPKIIKLF